MKLQIPTNNEKRALTFSKDDMESFILEWEDDLENADAETRELYRMFVGLLLADRNPTALHAKAYGCYGGNAAFPCDWAESARCLKALLDFPGYEYAAGSLGYIYYYGRTSDKQPQYKKAFRYFSRGAAAGDYESMYKLADMYKNGYYVPEDPELAHQIISQVYKETKALFLEGDDISPFADAALRMGYDVLDESPYDAAAYFQEADLAIRARMKAAHLYGDKKVFSKIRKALGTTGLRMEEERKSRRLASPSVFYTFLTDTPYDRYLLKVKEAGKESLRLTLERLPRRRETEAIPSLVSIPAIQWAARTTDISMYAMGVQKVTGKGNFIIDEMEVNGSTTIFYHNGKAVLTLTADGYEIKNEKRKEERRKGKVCTFASVQFEPGGATYDYLCEIPGVVKGSIVIVPGYNGATNVKVVDVFQSKMKDMPLPAARYKHILGLASSSAY